MDALCKMIEHAYFRLCVIATGTAVLAFALNGITYVAFENGKKAGLGELGALTREMIQAEKANARAWENLLNENRRTRITRSPQTMGI